MSGAKSYDKILEKATSSLLLEVDWESILSICDLIRQGDVQSKYAISQLKKKLSQENMNTVLFSLQCLESMVKNCGSKIHQELATKDTMELLRSLTLTKSDPIKMKVLELIQCWAHAFKKNPNYKIVEDYYNSMKLEGFQYPALKESDAMFDVEEAPQWKEDNETTCCFRCRSEFTTLKRRHHCRACGQIFCHVCSSKTAPIPKFGIEKEVRVCDLCYDKLNGASANNNIPSGLTSSIKQEAGNRNDLPAEYVNSALFKESIAASKNPKQAQTKSEQEFEDELQLALAISQSEAEAQESQKRRSSTGSGNKSNSSTSSSSQNYQKQNKSFDEPKKSSMKSKSRSSSDNLNASAPYLENSKTSLPQQNFQQDMEEPVNNEQILLSSQSDEEIKINNEIDNFVDSSKKTLEIYINRMKSDSLRGRSITNDTAVQSLFLQLEHMHPKLLSYIQYQEDARGYYENLQDKLTQLKDAREALNALRHENFESKKREMEEKERQRQAQIALKLQHMRQQKQNYYQYQNQLNLQHLQEKERELQMRMDQQRQLVMQRDQQFLGQTNGLPYQSMPNQDFNQMNNNPNQLPYQMQQQPNMIPPNYQQYMQENNFHQANVSPSKLASSMGNMTLHNNNTNNQQPQNPNIAQNEQFQQQQQQIPYLNQRYPNQFNSQQQFQNQFEMPQPQNSQMSQINQSQGQVPTINDQNIPVNGHISNQNGQIPQNNGQIPQNNAQLPPVNGQNDQASIQNPSYNYQQGPPSNYYQQPINNPTEIQNQSDIKPPMSSNEAQLISFD